MHSLEVRIIKILNLCLYIKLTVFDIYCIFHHYSLDDFKIKLQCSSKRILLFLLPYQDNSDLEEGKKILKY